MWVHVFVSVWCVCLCVSVCFQRALKKGERGVTHSAVLPTILPPGDKDASAYISRYGYRRKRCADVTHLVCSCVTSSTFEPSLHHRPITAYYHGNSHNPWLPIKKKNKPIYHFLKPSTQTKTLNMSHICQWRSVSLVMWLQETLLTHVLMLCSNNRWHVNTRISSPSSLLLFCTQPWPYLRASPFLV